MWGAQTQPWDSGSQALLTEPVGAPNITHWLDSLSLWKHFSCNSLTSYSNWATNLQVCGQLPFWNTPPPTQSCSSVDFTFLLQNSVSISLGYVLGFFFSLEKSCGRSMPGPSTYEKYLIWSLGWAYNRRVKTTFPEKLEGIVLIIFWNPVLLMRCWRLVGYLFCRWPVFLSPETFTMVFVILRDLDYHQAVSRGFTGLWFYLFISLDTWAFSICRFKPFFS